MTRALALVISLSLAACGPAHPRRPIPDGAPPGRWESAGPTPVWVPTWLARDPQAVADAFGEVASAGVPAGYAVVVMDPGAFSAPSSPTGLAAGLCDYEHRLVYVAWRYPAVGDRLPALEHEVAHAVAWESTHDAAYAASVGH